MEFLFSCSTRSLGSIARCRVEHSKRNAIAPRAHVLAYISLTGQVEFNLNRMPKPTKSARRCTLEQLPSYDGGRTSRSVETVSLFEMKRVYGWWPCASQEQGEEMQLTVRLDSQVTWSNRTYFFFT